jgi:glutamyl-tRNA reductase
MDISMIGIDYSKACVENRELFALTVSQGVSIAKKIQTKYNARGCIVLSTCNRTELWFSGLKGSPLTVFLNEKEVQRKKYRNYFTERFNENAVKYLFELACGMHSQIFGENQIITQVNTALQNARDNGHVDSVLETLFRLAVTAAKKVKTDTELTSKDTSVPENVLSFLNNKFSSLQGRNCLVIGNGEIGKLMAGLLIQSGCMVTMTLRQYKYREAVIPEGCSAINYSKRYDIIGEMDYIFSATISPHYTLKYNDLADKLADKEYRMIDLAVPRDIEPRIKDIPNVILYDMDSFGMKAHCDEQEIKKAGAILLKYRTEFEEWYNDRNYIPVIHKIGAAAGEITDAKLTKQYKRMDISIDEKLELRKNIQTAAQKSVEKLIFTAKEYMDSMQWNECIDAFNRAIDQFEQV